MDSGRTGKGESMNTTRAHYEKQLQTQANERLWEAQPRALDGLHYRDAPTQQLNNALSPVAHLKLAIDSVKVRARSALAHRAVRDLYRPGTGGGSVGGGMNWISVKDRLPDYELPVLVSNGCVIWVAERIFTNKKGENWKHIWDRALDSRITYWMPL